MSRLDGGVSREGLAPIESFVVMARLPPPLGGVSVFSKRKIMQLVRQGCIVTVVDFSSRVWPLRLISCAWFRRRSRYLVQTIRPGILVLLFLLGLMSRVSLYDHNHSRHLKPGTFRYGLFSFFARRAREIVVVHEHLISFHQKMGVTAIRVESPFIPPDESEEESILATYPHWVLEYVSGDEGPCILNSASNLAISRNGEDLYGVYETLKLIKRLRENGVPARLLFACPLYDAARLSDAALQLIEELQTQNAVRFLHGQKEIWPLFKRVRGFLRTTATDGESVSVLEALYFSCPVVASDVVPRPTGVITYRFGDGDSLYYAVRKAFLI